MGGDERMVYMTKKVITNNGIEISIETEYEYVSLVSASEYEEDTQGLMILWWNPKVCNGESQLDSEVFPFTVEGLLSASKEARALNSQIAKEVEDNTFTFRR